jgi:pimeloyl-ACP methyl ester carboxylesterase
MTTLPIARADGIDSSHVAQIGQLETFYIDAPGGAPPLLLLHGLSANAHSFSGLIAAGLSPAHRVIAPDLRGRGRSGKPSSGYSMSDHAGDVIALMDSLELDRVVLGGHSFGGYLAIYIAAHYPERVEKLVVIDAAVAINPRAGEMLKPSLDRLSRVFASAPDYLAELRAAPYMGGVWDENVEQYFRAEILVNADGTAQSATSSAAIGQAMVGIANEPWLHWVQQVTQPTLLFNALGAYGPAGYPALVDALNARATARAFRDARYRVVPGNHLTMIFGEGAAVIRRDIEDFVSGNALVDES